MPLIFIFSAISMVFQWVGVLKTTSLLTNQAQRFCQGLRPNNLHEVAAWNGLICGVPLSDPQLFSDLKTSTLLHLFVVSGSHLLWLDTGMQLLKIPAMFRTLFWIAFVFLSGGDPPIVRAAIGLILAQTQILFIPPRRGDLHVLATGLITLALVPLWYDSLSFALSWVAALAISLPFPRGWKGAIAKASVAWVFLLPFIAPLGGSHPWGIFLNLFLAPAIGMILLPLGCLAMIPPLACLFDGAMGILRGILALTRQMPPVAFDLQPLGRPERWVWLMGIHMSLHFFLLIQSRIHHLRQSERGCP